MTDKPSPATKSCPLCDCGEPCADGHAPIRYTGDKCPLCDAFRLDGEMIDELRHERNVLQKICAERSEEIERLTALLGPEHVARLDTVRAALSRPSEAPVPMPSGLKCRKVPHTRTGHLHAEDDDSPYDVDGLLYCGRCHWSLTNGVCTNQPGAGEEGE